MECPHNLIRRNSTHVPAVFSRPTLTARDTSYISDGSKRCATTNKFSSSPVVQGCSFGPYNSTVIHANSKVEWYFELNDIPGQNPLVRRS